MKKLFVSIVTTVLSMNLYASMGSFQFVDYSFGNPNSDFYPRGAIYVKGLAAEEMWKAMVNAPVKPAVKNLLEMSPSDVSLEMCESRIGSHYICRKVPQGNDTEFIRDNEGNVIYQIACQFNLSDISKGEIILNKIK